MASNQDDGEVPESETAMASTSTSSTEETSPSDEPTSRPSEPPYFEQIDRPPLLFRQSNPPYPPRDAAFVEAPLLKGAKSPYRLLVSSLNRDLTSDDITAMFMVYGVMKSFRPYYDQNRQFTGRVDILYWRKSDALDAFRSIGRMQQMTGNTRRYKMGPNDKIPNPSQESTRSLSTTDSPEFQPSMDFVPASPGLQTNNPLSER